MPERGHPARGTGGAAPVRVASAGWKLPGSPRSQEEKPLFDLSTEPVLGSLFVRRDRNGDVQRFYERRNKLGDLANGGKCTLSAGKAG